MAISSIAQQARPIGIGQSEFLRIQFMAASSSGENDVAFDLRIVGDGTILRRCQKARKLGWQTALRYYPESGGPRKRESVPGPLFA